MNFEQNLPVVYQNIGNEQVQTVDARRLHSTLEIGKDFTNWVKQQVNRAQLVENIDYIIFAQKGENYPNGGRPTIEYILTLDAAKHIAMMSHSEKGKLVRQYFIEVEKRFREQSRSGLALVKTEPGSLTALEAMRNQFVAQMDVLIDHERRLQLVVKQTQTLEDRVDTMEAERQAVVDSLTEIPEPAVEAPVETTRVKLIKVVDSIVSLGGMDHQTVWRVLYRELTLRCHFDVGARQRFAPKKTKLQIVEEAGQMENLYAIAFEKLETIKKGVA